MNKEDKDALVIDYLMDELYPHEREEFSKELEQDAGLRELLAEYQTLGELAKEELAKEPAPELAELQRRRIEEAATKARARWQKTVKRLLWTSGGIGLAAGLVFTLSVLARAREAYLSPESKERIARLVEEMDRQETRQAIRILQQQAPSSSAAPPPSVQSMKEEAPEPAQAQSGGLQNVDIGGKISIRESPYAYEGLDARPVFAEKAEAKKGERIDYGYAQPTPAAPPLPAAATVSTLGSTIADPAIGAAPTSADSPFIKQRGRLNENGVVELEKLSSLGYLGGPPANRPSQGGFGGGSLHFGTQDDFFFQPRPAIQPNTEAYGQYVEQAFQTVAQQPLSTFSIDVDTASYSNVRRFLTQQGQLPPPDAVRVEELINYFDYNYPQPTGEHPFSVQVDLAGCPWAPEHLLARVGLQGKSVPRGERPAANLVFLLDVSGSMDEPNKLPLVKESMKALLDTLQLNDRVGIVTYAGNSQIALMSTSCDNKPAILQAIDALGAGGSTNGAAGIHDAYTMAANNFIAGGINRVVLATDGDFNVGETDPGALLRLIAEKARGKVFLTALGFGMGNLKDGRLEELADKGNGNYAYIDSFAEARKALVDQVNGTLMTIAKDVKIQVEFNPSKVGSYRLIGYDNRVLAAQDFNDDTKDAGEIGAGHRVTALYEIVPVGAPVQAGVDALKYQPNPKEVPFDQYKPEAAPNPEWLTAKLRYKLPEGDTSTKLEVPVTAEPVAMPQASADFRLASSVAAFGLVLKNSPYKGSATLDMAQQLAQSALSAEKPEQRQQRQELVDLIVRAKTLRP